MNIKIEEKIFIEKKIEIKQYKNAIILSTPKQSHRDLVLMIRDIFYHHSQIQPFIQFYLTVFIPIYKILPKINKKKTCIHIS